MEKVPLEPYKTLEEILSLLLEKAKNRPISIQSILEILSGKGRDLVLIFLSLPFCQPIQIPGLSLIFGIIIGIVGFRLAFGHHIWLPKSLLKRTLTLETLKKIIAKMLWITKKLKPLTYPRLSFFCHHPSMHILNGLLIALLGFFLAMPLPIPLTNLAAGWGIFLISFGLLEDDGLFVCIGYGIFALCVVLFGMIFFYSIEYLIHFIKTPA